ncbi:MAG: hypothetical protein QOG69_1421 [Actinomycetota bacterium]|jgi:hypothetical protein|nr:hypothetical protein [Actinomycetota bacterium]
MQGRFQSAGEVVHVDSGIDWVSSLLVEGAAGGMTYAADDRLAADGGAATTVRLVVEADRRPFPEEGAAVLTRGAWVSGDAVVFADACASGFALRVQPSGSELLVHARYRPTRQVRAASLVLRSRFHLIARAVLMQYPALWWAGVRGRPPLHVCAMTTGSGVALLAGPGGVGKSTLLARELQTGGVATCDNLAVSDGDEVFGVAEPIRSTSGTGRRAPHGRREMAWTTTRSASLRPERVVVVELGSDSPATCAPTTGDVASRSLVTGTLMAGELRRYWAFAATLAAGTGLGPAQPEIKRVADRLATRLPCHVVTLSRGGTDTVSGLFAGQLSESKQ